MSIEAVGQALFLQTGNPTSKAVLIALANYADENGECWPSVGRVAEIAEVSLRTARYHLRALEEAGLVSVETRSRDGRGQTSNQYRLHLTPPAESAAPPRQNLPPPPAARCRGPRQPVAGGIEEPSLEPSGEDLFGRALLESLTLQGEVADDSQFDSLWIQHPRGHKAKAKAEYRKARNSGVSHDRIADALAQYVASFRDDFQGAHLWRWVRDRRWEEWETRAPSANGVKVTEGSAARFL